MRGSRQSGSPHPFFEVAETAMVNPVSDHAVVVTGVDTANGVVHLNDSGTPDGRDEQIPMALFAKAWATSHNFMVITTGTGN
jgi:hypothetical protein